MIRLYAAWVWLSISGFILLALDLISHVLVSVKGVPALGVIGAALILLVLTSILNWLLKEAWEERGRGNSHNHNNEPTR